jgi:hypothetical protein
MNNICACFRLLFHEACRESTIIKTPCPSNGMYTYNAISFNITAFYNGYFVLSLALLTIS